MAEWSGGDSGFGLAVRALLVFIVLDFGSRLFGFAGVYRFVQWWSQRSTAAASEPGKRSRVVDRTLEAVRIATRYYWRRGPDCLPRSLTVYLLLRRQGVPATLHIGVKRYPFGAHAWVECEGRVPDDAANAWRHEPYVPIISMQSGRRGREGRTR